MTDANASSTQDEAIQKLMSQFEQQAAPLDRQRTARELELKAALLADKVDQSKIDHLVVEISRLEGELLKLEVAMQVRMSEMGIYDDTVTCPRMAKRGKCAMASGSETGRMGGMGKGQMMPMMGHGMMGGMGKGQMMPMMGGMGGMTAPSDESSDSMPNHAN